LVCGKSEKTTERQNDDDAGDCKILMSLEVGKVLYSFVRFFFPPPKSFLILLCPHVLVLMASCGKICFVEF